MVYEKKESSGRSLEEEFFARQNQELMQKLRAQKTRAETKTQLSQYSGIKDDSVLESLLNQNIQPSTLVALTFVPLILTAWADRTMETAERNAILKAMAEQGIDVNHAAYELLSDWLKEAPGPHLFETWKTYVKGLGQTMERTAFLNLKTQIMQRTRSVAEAAGGYLGLGSKVSAIEKEQMTQLENAFL
ncbi:MAG TPA: hypothetical protein VE954_25015 [Oligoflexus sp.]|uniref:hypothetical protein n=1 Tax=Oligoflexus sp. TaxID=1971216 RepID=UPI002D2565C6|nr:hypothetical protein [Oligoflexus sp.]HYX36380.1 hypothetical protein [Oligoflexus sp.]